ncbi:MAG TPA: methylmalonyl-CoA mutase family protein [Polyangia bacterium]|jgi:methylmalonyl-CoA mutase N-terminal domain/subunit|nr:methylmalonyl-CoA mutase family protein [Polyangia bacterium]
MSSAAKKTDRRPPAATDAGAHRRPVPAGAERRQSLSGLPLEAVYGPGDLGPDWSYDDRLGDPGRFPFTRGPHETMYRGKLWTMRMFSGFGTPADTNRRFKFLLAQGQTGLSTAFDMPTLMGLDPDDPLSRGEVGREGVAVSSIADMADLFADIPLAEVTTSMTINAPAVVLLSFYVAVAEQRGIGADRLAGTIQNDMLKEFIAQKEWICGIRPHMRIVRDMLVHCTKRMPRWNTISVSGYHIREAGATAVQELAFTLADGIGYVELGLEAGLAVDDFAPRLSFFWDVHNDFFEEVAKFRAARRIWARIMRDRFKAQNPRSWLLRAHAQTAGVSLMAQQPLNNVVRTTLQALAAVLGGTQSLHTNSYDETFALPTEQAAALALRTQQIIAEESGVPAVADPLGGSYFVEALTDRMEAEARALIDKIDGMGGIVRAVEEGFPQREIAASAYQAQRQIDRGDRVIVGVNRHVTERQEKIPTLKIDHEPERSQIQRIGALRARRNAIAARAALDGVRRACAGDDNIMDAVLEAAKKEATLGEICQVFRDVFGEYRDPGYV